MTTTIDTAKRELIAAKAAEWRDRLVDLSFRNTLLYFHNTKNGSLDLSEADPDVLADLETGKSVTLRMLFADTDRHRDACTRARSLSRRITLLGEEQGIDAGRAAFGFIRTGASQRGGSGSAAPLRAPLLLRPMTIKARTATESDYSLELGEDLELNPVLLYALDTQYGVDTHRLRGELTKIVRPDRDRNTVEQNAFDLLAGAARKQGIELHHEPAVALGVFSYEKLAMVGDLATSTDLLTSHDVVAALAGYTPAREALATDAARYRSREIDELHPGEEFLVHDADSSQHRAVMAALAGQNVLIEGPPGTGKSQTIANIIAGAAARGQTVLFVAEKRAAIDAVKNRLIKIGLGRLMLDLHQDHASKRDLARQLAESLDHAGKEPRVEVGSLHDNLAGARRRLVEHSRALHAQRDPWGVSAYDVRARLLDLPKLEIGCSFHGEHLRLLDKDTAAALEQALQEFVFLGGMKILRQETPWCRTGVRDQNQVERILIELNDLAGSTLHRSQQGMDHVLRTTGLARPDSVTGWQDVLELLDEVSTSVQMFGPAIFGDDLDTVYLATADRKQRKQIAPNRTIGWFERRRLLKQLRELTGGRIYARVVLHTELGKVRAQRHRWKQLGGLHSEPTQVAGLAGIIGDYQRLRRQLASVALSAQRPELETGPEPQIGQWLQELRADKDMLFRMPRLNQHLDYFRTLGLDAFLSHAARLELNAPDTWLAFQRAWLASLDDEFKLRIPEIGQFVAEQMTAAAEDFRGADISHRNLSANRVRYEADTRSRTRRDAYPEQTRILRAQAARKSRHMAPRKLVEQTSDVLLALRPCWAMSPLVVSRMLPAQKLFDLVIFDEASQIRPHDAITSIMRGAKIVVAGDEKQLPPTDFFQRVLDSDDEPDDDQDSLFDYESILTALRPLLPINQTLTWHYRSTDERLIAFSNHTVYQDKLVTFPGSHTISPVSLVRVDGRSSPGQDGSAPEEVAKVVELIIDHARTRPDRSLGVIALNVKHQARIERAFTQTRQQHPDLDEFFSTDVDPTRRFFIKNLESVQGDERDAIILSVGIARDSAGRISGTSFGPLNREGTERRINVAVTRATSRMTVVASFSAADLSPAVKNGTALLRAYLEFAEHHGRIDEIGIQKDVELNGFERAIADALADQGITAFPQWGVSDYLIDFALVHPQQPGRMILAVEADGHRYHSSASARDRDRLRQAHLEKLGWRFHRVWSSAWFADPACETNKIVTAWRAAVADADTEPAVAAVPIIDAVSTPQPPPRGPRPNILAGKKIADYSNQELISICRWLMTDGLQLDREERLTQVMAELCFHRHGSRIVERLLTSIDTAQRLTDQEQ
ncbi:AAA domain-containing protein [Nocardia sp. NPDC004711]